MMKDDEILELLPRMTPLFMTFLKMLRRFYEARIPSTVA